MLRVEGLQINLAQKVVLKNLSFEITAPCFVAILGHNGSGKTSLLKAILNLLPFKGEISFSSPPALLSQKNTLLFDLKASELAVMGAFSMKKFLEHYSFSDYKKVKNIFERLSIAHLYDTSVLALSGGEQQLVWLAQVLMQDSKFILLDEPTQSLDIRNKKIVFDCMQQLVKEENKTILCVTHDLHNLYAMKGYLLNLSDPALRLELLTKETLDRHVALLEA